MSDIWTELDLNRWTWKVPRDTLGPYVAEHIPKPLIVDWVEKWKPIINDAFEKAEKWDEILPYLRKYGIIAKFSFKQPILSIDELPNMVGLDKAIGNSEYIIKCLTMIKESILKSLEFEDVPSCSEEAKQDE